MLASMETYYSNEHKSGVSSTSMIIQVWRRLPRWQQLPLRCRCARRTAARTFGDAPLSSDSRRSGGPRSCSCGTSSAGGPSCTWPRCGWRTRRNCSICRLTTLITTIETRCPTRCDPKNKNKNAKLIL